MTKTIYIDPWMTGIAYSYKKAKKQAGRWNWV